MIVNPPFIKGTVQNLGKILLPIFKLSQFSACFCNIPPEGRFIFKIVSLFYKFIVFIGIPKYSYFCFKRLAVKIGDKFITSSDYTDTIYWENICDLKETLILLESF